MSRDRVLDALVVAVLLLGGYATWLLLALAVAP